MDVYCICAPPLFYFSILESDTFWLPALCVAPAFSATILQFSTAFAFLNVPFSRVSRRYPLYSFARSSFLSVGIYVGWSSRNWIAVSKCNKTRSEYDVKLKLYFTRLSLGLNCIKYTLLSPSPVHARLGVFSRSSGRSNGQIPASGQPPYWMDQAALALPGAFGEPLRFAEGGVW